MKPNRQGQVVEECWRALPLHYPQIELDSFVVMPNHVHGIVLIHDDGFVGAGLRPAPTRYRYPLSEIVRAFKSFSARRINAIQNAAGRPVWQRNYFEHIVRSERSLNRIRQYIGNNVAQWQCDREHPLRESKDEFEAWLESEGSISKEQIIMNRSIGDGRAGDASLQEPREVTRRGNGVWPTKRKILGFVSRKKDQ